MHTLGCCLNADIQYPQFSLSHSLSYQGQLHSLSRGSFPHWEIIESRIGYCHLPFAETLCGYNYRVAKRNATRKREGN